MGIITDILGEGLKGLGTLVGYFLIIVALAAVVVAISQDNLIGWIMAVLIAIVGIGLIRYE